MAGFSDYVETTIMDWLFEATDITGHPTVSVSLHTADPADTGANELADTGAYARVTTAAGDWEGTVGARQNATEIAFTAATADWGTVTHFGLWDAAGVGSGSFLGGGSLTIPKSVYNGDQLKFTSGNLDFTLD